MADEARALNRVWTFAVEHGRPFVTWKFATTLDGRSAAADGTSRWVSSRAARLDTHRLRALCDVMLVGSNTIAVDDPQLTVRDERDRPLPRDRQPLRVVMGERDLSGNHRVFDDHAETLHLRTRDPETALKTLLARDRQHVFLEGGPTLAAAFLTAGLVDEIVTYVAPMLLGSGLATIGDLGITTIADALRPTVTDVTVLPGHDGDQPNVRLTMTPRPSVEEGGERPTPSVEEGAQRRPPSVEEGAKRPSRDPGTREEA
jgi:diaminohydroxyphosphoribosylaminopyrimidine deaminase/5-amino-6-(5-phosphoribosylamino)uracil reductase